MKVFVTGAGGFVGKALCRRLAAAGHSVIAGLRSEINDTRWVDTRVCGDLETTDDFTPFVAGADAVVHLAARVHIMRETATDPDTAYHRANASVTEKLATAAAQSGVQRFVFLSSIKVNGENTSHQVYSEKDNPAPEGAYGRSKLAAEQALQRISGETGLSCVTLRVPLVYGPGVGANFAALLRLCDMPIPLPLGGITGNRRSLLFAGNLTNAIQTVLEEPAGPPGTYLLSDGEDLSTTGLVRRLRYSLNQRVRDLPVPAGLLRALAGLAGKKATADRLCGSLQIDSTHFRQSYDWAPAFSVNQGLAATAAWLRALR